MAKKKKEENFSEFETFAFDDILKQVKENPNQEEKNKIPENKNSKEKSNAIIKFCADIDLQNGRITREKYIELLNQKGIPIDEAILNQSTGQKKLEFIEKKIKSFPSPFITSKANSKKSISIQDSKSKKPTKNSVLKNSVKPLINKKVSTISEIEEYLLSNYEFVGSPFLVRVKSRIFYHFNNQFTSICWA